MALTGRWSEWREWNTNPQETGTWVYDEANDVLINRANQGGFSGVCHPGFISWDDYAVEAEVWVDNNSDDDGIGIAFRWQDEKNFYYFMMDNGSVNDGLGYPDHMRLGKFVNGQHTVLSSAFHPHPWLPGRHYKVKVAVAEKRIRVWVDGVLQYDVEDDSLSHGSFGPVTFSQAGACFTDFRAYLLPVKVFKSGIGDLDDCRVRPPREHLDPVDFKYSARVYGSEEKTITVFPAVTFGYSVWAEGSETQLLGPYPYKFGLKAYPEASVLCRLTAEADYPATFDYVLSADAQISAPQQYNFRIKVNYTDSQGGTGGGKADIIWVVDGSGSMGPYQQAIANNASTFINILTQKNIDYRLGVVGYSNYAGKINSASGDGWTTSGTEFGQMVTSVGTNWGDGGTENGLTAINFALDNYVFRLDANIYLIMVTDEDADDYNITFLTQTIDRLRQRVVVVHGIINTADSLGYINGGVIDQTGGVYQDITTTSDWSATLSQIAGNIAARIDGYTGYFQAQPAVAAGWTAASTLTVRQLVEQAISQGSGDLPPDLFTNSRYTVNTYTPLADNPQVELKLSYSQDGSDTAPSTHPEADTAYVVGHALTESTQTQAVTVNLRCQDLPLSANSDTTKVAVTQETAQQILQPYIPPGTISVSNYRASTTYPGAYVTTSSDGSTPVYAWATQEATHYTGDWQITFKVYAYEGEKIVASASDYLPTNAAGRPYPGTQANYTLNKLSGEADVYWVRTGNTGPGFITDEIAVKTKLEYYGGEFDGEVGGGQTLYFDLPREFKDQAGAPMPYYPVVTYQLEDLSRSEAYFYFESNPAVATSRTGRKFIYTQNKNDRVMVAATAQTVTVPWRSQPYRAYGTVNGAVPMTKELDGYAPYVVPMPEIEIPENVSVLRYVVGDISDSRVSGAFASTEASFTYKPDDTLIFRCSYTETRTITIPWVSEEFIGFGRVYPDDIYTSPPLSSLPLDRGRLVVRSLTPGVEVWAEGDRVKAKLVSSSRGPWHPYVHSGYYAVGDKPFYLYAENAHQDEIFVPDENLRIYVSPPPQQGAPVIVKDARGEVLREVAFLEDDGSPTLYNTERLSGIKGNKVYLLYDGIDPASLEITINGEQVSGSIQSNLLTLPVELKPEDELVVRYALLDSYYVDPNPGIADTAVIQLYRPSYEGQYSQVRVEYETSVADPYYLAGEVNLNPIQNHNHTGFFYISAEPQYFGSLLLNVSPETILSGSDQPAVITVTLLDRFGNPLPGELVKVYFQPPGAPGSSFVPGVYNAASLLQYFPAGHSAYTVSGGGLNPSGTAYWLSPGGWAEVTSTVSSNAVVVQFELSDHNDGYADVFVDGALHASYYLRNTGNGYVEIRGLPQGVHRVKVQARDGDVHLQFVGFANMAYGQKTILAYGYTNEAGEFYYTFRPGAGGTVFASWRDQEVSFNLDHFVPVPPPAAHLKVEVSSDMAVPGQDITITVRLYDSAWRPLRDTVKLEYANDAGQMVQTALTTDAWGRATYTYRATSTKRTVRFTAYYRGAVAWASVFQRGVA